MLFKCVQLHFQYSGCRLKFRGYTIWAENPPSRTEVRWEVVNRTMPWCQKVIWTTTIWLMWLSQKRYSWRKRYVTRKRDFRQDIAELSQPTELCKALRSNLSLTFIIEECNDPHIHCRANSRLKHSIIPAEEVRMQKIHPNIHRSFIISPELQLKGLLGSIFLCG